MKRLILFLFIINIISLFSQWEEIDMEVIPLQPFIRNDTLIIGRLDGLIQYSTNNGDNWSFFKNLNGGCAYSLMINNILFVSCFDSVFISSDFGNTWSNSKLNPSIVVNWIYFYKNYFFVASFSDQSILMTSNFGLNWVEFANINQISSPISMIMKNDSIIVSCVMGLFYSSDFGKNWTIITSELQHGVGNGPLAYTILDSTIYVTYDTKLFSTTNLGKNWVLVYNFEPDSIYKDIGLDFYNFHVCNDFIYLNTYKKGIIYSKDKGKSWNLINSGLLKGKTSYQIFHNNEYLFVGSLDGGIYRAKLVNCQIDPTSVEEIKLPRPEGIYIFPNPAENNVEIKVSSGEISNFNLKIFTLTGIEIYNTSWYGDRSEKTIELDLKDYPSGLYSVVISTESGVQREFLRVVK